MPELSLDFVRKPLLSPELITGLARGDEIWKRGNTRIYYPENPLVPGSEGIHLRIEATDAPLHPKTPQEWKKFFETWAVAIGSGKVVAEGKDLDDMWQSFIDRTEYSPEDHLVIDVIGRNPKGESWAKTAPLPDVSYDNRKNRLPQEKVEQFRDTLHRYFDMVWEPHIAHQNLFEQKMVVDPPGSAHFQEVFDKNTTLPFPWQSDPLFVSNYVDAVAILHPHLKSGLHIYIGVANTPRRPWNDLPRALQAIGLAEATAQVFEETKVGGEPIAADTSVRVTGSWYGGFKDLPNDPDFTQNFKHVPTKWLKRKYRGASVPAVGLPKAWTMAFHPHVYGVRKGELMRLTKRPRNEGGEDWEGITAMSKEKRTALSDALNARLPNMVKDMKGPLIQAI